MNRRRPLVFPGRRPSAWMAGTSSTETELPRCPAACTRVRAGAQPERPHRRVAPGTHLKPRRLASGRAPRGQRPSLVLHAFVDADVPRRSPRPGGRPSRGAEMRTSAGNTLARVVRASGAAQRRPVRSRRALAMTLTEDRAMAAAAIIGESRSPKVG